MIKLLILCITSLLTACGFHCKEPYESSFLTPIGSLSQKNNCPASKPAIFVTMPQACTAQVMAATPGCCAPLFPLIHDPISITDPEPVMTSPRIREYF